MLYMIGFCDTWNAEIVIFAVVAMCHVIRCVAL